MEKDQKNVFNPADIVRSLNLKFWHFCYRPNPGGSPLREGNGGCDTFGSNFSKFLFELCSDGYDFNSVKG